MEPQDERRSMAAHLHRVGADADPAAIARAVVETWQSIAAELGSVIGPRGVAALYQHSLKRVAPAHPWLAGALDEKRAQMDLPSLERVLASRDRADAMLGAQAVLQTFSDLLATLVGTSLTDRLLRPVWVSPSTTPSAPGIPP